MNSAAQSPLQNFYLTCFLGLTLYKCNLAWRCKNFLKNLAKDTAELRNTGE